MDIIEKIKEINKKWHNIIEKRDYLKNKIKHSIDLENRSECPYCYQKINWKEFEKAIPELKEELRRFEKDLEEILPKKRELELELGRIWEKRRKNENKSIEEYIKQNKVMMDNVIKNYRKGVVDFLPKINNDEKELWNKAIEKYYTDKYEDGDEDELLYDI